MADSENETGAERCDATPEYARLASVEAELADGELTQPRKLDLLLGWDVQHGRHEPASHGRVADAADLGFSDPAPYSPEVRKAIAELCRLHRDALPAPEDVKWPWSGDAGH